MKQLNNGWHVPEHDQKMTGHVEEDSDITDPEYERRHRTTILKHIPKKEVFVDVGANIGVWSLPMSYHFSKVYSYEPSSTNRSCLEKNLNGRIEIRPYALGNENKKVAFHEEIKNCGNSKIWVEGSNAETYQVDMVRLDDQQIENCSLIKIDVQGFELGVIQGAEQLIKTQQPWVIFELSADVDVICNFFEDLNYEMIFNKSKRVFIWAPKEGPMAPLDSSAFGRQMGAGPYIKLLPEDKQQIAKSRHG
jgi:FkbM family methyltransferase